MSDYLHVPCARGIVQLCMYAKGIVLVYAILSSKVTIKFPPNVTIYMFPVPGQLYAKNKSYSYDLQICRASSIVTSHRIWLIYFALPNAFIYNMWLDNSLRLPYTGVLSKSPWNNKAIPKATRSHCYMYARINFQNTDMFLK